MMKHVLTLSLLFLTAVVAPAQDKPAKPDKPEKDKPAAKKEAVDFEKQIWPILEKRCIECHATPQASADGKPKKPKGGVILDSKTGITTSKGGKLVIAKNANDSKIVASISLPADDEDRMPPAKKGEPLSKEQIDLIKAWIDHGAEFGSWTGKAAAKDAPKDNGKDAPPAGGKPGDKPSDKDKKGKEKEKEKDHHVALGADLKPLPPAVLASFADGPFLVQGAGDGSPLLAVSCAGRTDEVDDAALAKLAPLAQHVTELDLGHTHVTDEGCAVLAKMPLLTSLDLRQTAVSNHGTAALAACKELRTLNLFGTKAGDYGVAALTELKHLENLYVWQTDVSASALVRLRETLPDVRVVVAADLPEPMTEAPAGGRRRANK